MFALEAVMRDGVLSVNSWWIKAVVAACKRVKSNAGEKSNRILNVKQYVKRSGHVDNISATKYAVRIELLQY
jgi:hypothetical protein